MKLTEYSSSGSNSSNNGSSVSDEVPIAATTAYTIASSGGANGVVANGNGTANGRSRHCRHSQKDSGKKRPRYDPFQMRDKTKATTCVVSL